MEAETSMKMEIFLSIPSDSLERITGINPNLVGHGF